MTGGGVDRLPEAPWRVAPATRRVVEALGPGRARFVGGCVRDTLLGRAGPNLDIDLATPLEPPEVLAALVRAKIKAVPTGVEHGVVTAVASGRPFEIATLRRDVKTDGRRAVVAFTHDWAEDAARRDFRLNALYADPDGRLHDPTGEGIADALSGRIVFVGEPARRIREDYLRILRFFRFFAAYGHGEPDAAALDACSRLRGGLAKLSAERVTKEVLRLLAAPDPVPAVEAMAGTGVLEEVLPGASPARLARLVALQTALGEAGDPALRLAALSAEAPDGLGRLRLSNAMRDRVAASRGGVEAPAHGVALRRRVHDLGGEVFADRLRLGADPSDAGAVAAALSDARALVPRRLPLSGEDIKALGVAEGPAVGRLRRAVEAWWVEADFPDDPEAVRAALRRLASQNPST